MFSDCLAEEFLFYGVCNYRFKLNDTVWEVIEDESDGYRSMLGSVEVTSSKTDIFFREPLAIISVTEDPEAEGFCLIDAENGHIWLRFGTDNAEDYYPKFYFNYEPMAPVLNTPRHKASTVRKIHDHDIHPFDRLFDQRES